MILLTVFAVNAYQIDSCRREYEAPNLLSQTDASQAEDVRSILQRFALTGFATGRDSSRDSYLGSFSDDKQPSVKEMEDMLETPDLSMMDEMEVQDFIRDNTSFTNTSDQDNLSPEKTDPGSDHPSESDSLGTSD